MFFTENTCQHGSMCTMLPSIVSVVALCALVLVVVTTVAKKRARKFLDVEAGRSDSDQDQETYSSQPNSADRDFIVAGVLRV